MSKCQRYQIYEEHSWSFQVGSLRGQQGPGRGVEGCKRCMRWDDAGDRRWIQGLKKWSKVQTTNGAWNDDNDKT